MAGHPMCLERRRPSKDSLRKPSQSFLPEVGNRATNKTENNQNNDVL